MKYIEKKIVTSCYHSCPFFKVTTDGMECDHPFFENDGYNNMIITQDNSRGRVPFECPLILDETIMEIHIRLDKNSIKNKKIKHV